MSGVLPLFGDQRPRLSPDAPICEYAAESSSVAWSLGLFGFSDGRRVCRQTATLPRKLSTSARRLAATLATESDVSKRVCADALTLLASTRRS